jgi:hypothetical protein
VSNGLEIRPIRLQSRTGRSWRLSGTQWQISPRGRLAKFRLSIRNHVRQSKAASVGGLEHRPSGRRPCACDLAATKPHPCEIKRRAPGRRAMLMALNEKAPRRSEGPMSSLARLNLPGAGYQSSWSFPRCRPSFRSSWSLSRPPERGSPSCPRPPD